MSRWNCGIPSGPVVTAAWAPTGCAALDQVSSATQTPSARDRTLINIATSVDAARREQPAEDHRGRYPHQEERDGAARVDAGKLFASSFADDKPQKVDGLKDDDDGGCAATKTKQEEAEEAEISNPSSAVSAHSWCVSETGLVL